MADALKAKGIATWDIEYRRIGQAGSGWPGTYLDVGRGVDYLRAIAAQNHLDLTRVIAVGHSNDGLLAMWVAARSRLPKSSLIYVSDPLPIRGVIDLAGIIDLEAFISIEQRRKSGNLHGAPLYNGPKGEDCALVSKVRNAECTAGILAI